VSVGLEIRDQAGAIRLSVTSRIMRLHSRIGVYNGATGSLFIPVAGMTPDGTWVVFVVNASWQSGFGWIETNDATASIRNGGVFLSGSESAHALAVVYRC
jgi:hypothetical protein